MRIARLTIENFRNLPAIDVALAPGTVIVGGNRAGKSNLLFAVRLVLDPTLSTRERLLDRSDFSDSLNPGTDGGDPMREGRRIEISIELTDIEQEPALLAALGDALIEGEPMRAKLTYRFEPEDDDGEDHGGDGASPRYGWKIVGGEDDNDVRWDVRRFLAQYTRSAVAPTASTIAAWSMRKLECTAAAGVSPARTISGVRLFAASAIPVIAFVRPGPW